MTSEKPSNFMDDVSVSVRSFVKLSSHGVGHPFWAGNLVKKAMDAGGAHDRGDYRRHAELAHELARDIAKVDKRAALAAYEWLAPWFHDVIIGSNQGEKKLYDKKAQIESECQALANEIKSGKL